MAGLVLSRYFAGFTLSALRCEWVIERIGHIRAYAGFAGLVVAATAMPLLMHRCFDWSYGAVVGFGGTGQFTTTASWLNAEAAPAHRGWVFSIYMVGTFLTLTVGQLLIGQPGSRQSGLSPRMSSASPWRYHRRRDRGRAAAECPRCNGGFRAAGRAAPVSVVGCMVSGFIGSAFYALVPAWMGDKGIAREMIVLFRLVAVLGGLAFGVE